MSERMGDKGLRHRSILMLWQELFLQELQVILTTLRERSSSYFIEEKTLALS